jgi:hypothetical protein
MWRLNPTGPGMRSYIDPNLARDDSWLIPQCIEGA